MISSRWIEKRKPYWDQLESIVGRTGAGGVARLSRRELRDLGLLYRQAAADLSSVREDPTSQRLAIYLNQLLGRAHNLIYMGQQNRSGGVLLFYKRDFPRIFRENSQYVLGAFALFLLTTMIGFLACLADPAFQRFFLGPAMSDTIERRRMWTHSIVTIKPLASSAIMTNNLSVSFLTFAMGITAGLGTAYMLATNGLLFGIIAGACWQAGLGLELAGFVAAHGVLELPAIFIAGGAGFLMARGLLFPGSLPRREALIFYGGKGVRLTLGIIPLLLVAGVIEAFVSPTSLPVGAKFLLAVALFGLLVLYLTRAGREPVTGR